MITELVSFRIPEEFDRAAMIADAQGTVSRWRDFPGLIRKHFVWDEAGRVGMGIYLWETLADADRAHDEAWLARAEARWGNRPVVCRYDCFMTLDNPGGVVSLF